MTNDNFQKKLFNSRTNFVILSSPVVVYINYNTDMKELVIGILKKAKLNNKQLTLKQIIKKVNNKTSLGGSNNSNGDLVTKIINEFIETKNIILHVNNDEKARYEIQDDENIYDYKDGHNNESYEFDAVKNEEISKNFNNNYDNNVDDDIPLQNHHHIQKYYDTDFDEAIPELKRQRNISENYNHHKNSTNLCAFTSTFALQPGNNYLQYK